MYRLSPYTDESNCHNSIRVMNIIREVTYPYTGKKIQLSILYTIHVVYREKINNINDSFKWVIGILVNWHILNRYFDEDSSWFSSKYLLECFNFPALPMTRWNVSFMLLILKFLKSQIRNGNAKPIPVQTEEKITHWLFERLAALGIMGAQLRASYTGFILKIIWLYSIKIR